LTEADGNSLQRDVQNSGNNQRAQLLFPTDKLNMALEALLEYKDNISLFSMRENNFLKSDTQAHPAEIYVLMAAAHHSLDLIKGLSPSTTWTNAPASIRQPKHPTNHQNRQALQTMMRDSKGRFPKFQSKADTQSLLVNTQQPLTDTNTTSFLMTKPVATQ
jgi:hypothetical protein